MKTYSVVQSSGEGATFSVIEFTDGKDARDVGRFYYREEADAYADARNNPPKDAEINKNWSVHGGPSYATVFYVHSGKATTLASGGTVSVMLPPEAALLMAAQLLQAVMEMKL